MRLAAALLLLGGCATLAESPCTDRAFAPFDEPPVRSTADIDAPRGLGDALIAWYQHALQPPELPGMGCPFHPSCSVFAREALDRWGVFGLVLIADRLFVREHAFAGASYPVHCDEQRALWDDPIL